MPNRGQQRGSPWRLFLFCVGLATSNLTGTGNLGKPGQFLKEVETVSPTLRKREFLLVRTHSFSGCWLELIGAESNWRIIAFVATPADPCVAGRATRRELPNRAWKCSGLLGSGSARQRPSWGFRGVDCGWLRVDERAVMVDPLTRHSLKPETKNNLHSD